MISALNGIEEVVQQLSGIKFAMLPAEKLAVLSWLTEYGFFGRLQNLRHHSVILAQERECWKICVTENRRHQITVFYGCTVIVNIKEFNYRNKC